MPQMFCIYPCTQSAYTGLLKVCTRAKWMSRAFILTSASSSQQLFTHLFIPESLSMGFYIQQQDLTLLWTISEVNRTEIIKIACGFSVFCEKRETTQISRPLGKNKTQICYLKVQCVISDFLVTPSTLAKKKNRFLNRFPKQSTHMPLLYLL